MGSDEIIPALALIAVLILVLPSFIRTNLKKKSVSKKFKYLGYNCVVSCDNYILRL